MTCKKIVSTILVLCMVLSGAIALAEEKTATVYGVYCLEGEHPDSNIRVTLTCDMDTKAVTGITIDEALIPYSIGGAEGWAVLSDETAALLGEDTVTVGTKKFAKYFVIGDILWTGNVDGEGNFAYSTEIDGQNVAFDDYIATQDGGEWYYANLEAALVNGAKETIATVAIETKASIEHGVGFWPSPITFPGNIQKIEEYVLQNGVTYGTYPEDTTIAKNDEGIWTVADVVTGATLAGAPNYLNLIKAAYDTLFAAN